MNYSRLSANFCKRTVRPALCRTPLGFSAHMADTIRRAIASDTQDDGSWAKEELT
jgi:hypothetical protein